MPGLRRIFRYMQPYRWIAIVGFFTVILPVIMELVTPRMVQFVIDKGIRGQNMAAVWQGSLVMLAAALIGAITTLGQGVCRAQISQGIAFDLRNALFRHIQSLSFADLDRLQTGQLMTRISSDVDVVRMFLSAGLALLLRALLMILGSLTMMLLIDVRLSMIMVSMLAITGLIIWYILRVTGPMFTAVQEKLAALNTMVQENLAGVRVVKAYVREPYAIERFAEVNEAYMEQNVRVGRYLAVVLPVLLVLTNVGAALAIWRGGLDVNSGRISIGELVAFNNYVMIGMSPLLLLSNILTMVSRANASAMRILEVLDTQPSIQPPVQPKAPVQESGQVAFAQVAFHYTGSRRNGGPIPVDGSRPVGEDVLDGVAFEIRPGERVAIMGATGAGKSTLLSLIPRFYDVTGGSVRVGGVDVREWAPARLRRLIGVVLQESLLFSGTVRDNIAYGRPDAPMEEIIAAAKAAQAHDFIMRMPDGYDSIVEARGANLSGGQKQRIAIARALVMQPSVLLLDDSTSSVDLDTEVRIQEALAEMMANVTTIFVAQRISSVVDADRILILEDGQIAAQGTHFDLLETSPIYQDIYRSQFGE